MGGEDEVIHVIVVLQVRVIIKENINIINRYKVQ
jgi:hypothetical protein